jgi:hypothetical protein
VFLLFIPCSFISSGLANLSVLLIVLPVLPSSWPPRSFYKEPARDWSVCTFYCCPSCCFTWTQQKRPFFVRFFLKIICTKVIVTLLMYLLIKILLIYIHANRCFTAEASCGYCFRHWQCVSFVGMSLHYTDALENIYCRYFSSHGKIEVNCRWSVGTCCGHFMRITQNKVSVALVVSRV